VAIPLRWVGIAILALVFLFLVAPFILSKWVLRAARMRNVVMRILVGVLGVIGFLAARLHLWIFDRMYLWYGSIETFNRQDSS
jgi:hypothetical protein